MLWRLIVSRRPFCSAAHALPERMGAITSPNIHHGDGERAERSLHRTERPAVCMTVRVNRMELAPWRIYVRRARQKVTTLRIPKIASLPTRCAGLLGSWMPAPGLNTHWNYGRGCHQ